MKDSEFIHLDLIYVIEQLIPRKSSVRMLRAHQKHLPVLTMHLKYCDSSASLQFALYQHCKDFSDMSHRRPLRAKEQFTGTQSEIDIAFYIYTNFLEGAYWWVDRYLTQFSPRWSNDKKKLWLTHFKLLVQAIIGIGNCKKSAWIIKNKSVLQLLTYNDNLAPFLNDY